MSHSIIGGDILSLDVQSIHTFICFCDSVCSTKTNHTSHINYLQSHYELDYTGLKDDL